MFVLAITLLILMILGVVALAGCAAMPGSNTGAHAGPGSWSMRRVPGRHRLVLVP